MRQTKKASTTEIIYTNNINKTGCKAPTAEVELRFISTDLSFEGILKKQK
jgi:hypothetical protein